VRFLAVTETCDLAALYLDLIRHGHDVRVSISEPLAQGTAAGLVPRSTDWRRDLDWVGRDGIILFEAVSTGLGAHQDALRRDGFKVVGGSAFGDRLENDRAFAVDLLRAAGLPPADSWRFGSAADADAFIAEHPGRYVLKHGGGDDHSTYAGMLADGRDVRAVLASRHDACDLLLMRHVAGIETGVGAYFDGHRFLRPACLDWEHKRFFPGDIGELTGEMGTVATFDRSGVMFDRTLARLEPLLAGHGHIGWINLNCIVNADGIWPLEFTCRFGYPGFAVLAPLQRCGWADLFQRLLAGAMDFDTAPGFSVGVVLTTPPFPYSRKDVRAPVGLPVLLDPADAAHLHYGEVGLDAAGRLVTSGLYGWTMVATGTGPTVGAARAAAYARIARITIPDMRYRTDVGAKLSGGDLARLECIGLLGPESRAVTP
jgi:phosphoribosylamine---glycine ligase